MSTLKNIDSLTDSQILKVAENPNSNDSLFNLQKLIGVDSGDVAGVVFAGDLEREWPSASVERRKEMIREYLSVERTIAANSANADEQYCFDATPIDSWADICLNCCELDIHALPTFSSI